MFSSQIIKSHLILSGFVHSIHGTRDSNMKGKSCLKWIRVVFCTFKLIGFWKLIWCDFKDEAISFRVRDIERV